VNAKRLAIFVAGAAAGASAGVLLSRRPATRDLAEPEALDAPPPAPVEPAPVAAAAAAAPPARRSGSFARRALVTLIAIGAVGAVAGFGSYSAFTSTTSNIGNGFTSGSVTLTDNDSNGAMLSLSNAKPGDSSTGCIKVTYTGSLAAAVHVYGSISGSLGTYLTLTVTRGTDSSPSFASCTNFTADATNYIGQGAGVVYNGNLSAFPADYASGVVDPTASWATNDAHSYKFVVTVQDNNSAQGLTATAGFTWEARNT